MIFTFATWVHVRVYWRKSNIFRSMKNSGLGKYSVITLLIQITFTLKHYYVFYKALKSWGKMIKKTYLPPLGKVCDLEFTGCSLQISTISLNMHRSLKIKQLWKIKNFNFNKRVKKFLITVLYIVYFVLDIIIRRHAIFKSCNVLNNKWMLTLHRNGATHILITVHHYT